MSDALESVREVQDRIQKAVDRMIREIVPGYEVVPPHLLPFGLGRAAKGRTVWRIVEEIIVQNLLAHAERLGLTDVERPEDEVGPFDSRILVCPHLPLVHLNVKAAAEGSRSGKNDVSKADAIRKFYAEHPNGTLLVATVFFRFEGTFLRFTRSEVMNVAWIDDVYVNPRNHNLQSSGAVLVPRAPADFVPILEAEMQSADAKRRRKLAGPGMSD